MTKRILMLLIAVFALGAFSSCEGPAGRDGLDGRDGENGLLSIWHIEKFTVEEGHWIPDIGENETLFYYDIPIQKLTQNIANDGVVVAYILDRDGTNFPLPHEGKYHGYSENIRFHYYKGGVTVEVVPSDQNIDYQPPTFTFKIILLY